MYELFPETTNVMVSGIFVATSGEYLRLEAFLPDGLDTLAEVVEDASVLGATSCTDTMACR